MMPAMARLSLELLCFALLWLMVYTRTDDKVNQCPTGGTPVLHMCKGGQVTQESVLLDFFYANNASVDYCKCTVLIVAGKQFSYSEISSPGYNGCGSEIKITRDNLGQVDERYITCLGGTTFQDLRSGETLDITLTKKYEPKDTKYCYRLDIANAPHPSMTVTCNEETTSTSTTTTTTTTTPSPTTTPSTTPTTTIITTTTPMMTTPITNTTTPTTTSTTMTTTTPTTTSTTTSQPSDTTQATTTSQTTKQTPEIIPEKIDQCPTDSDVLVGILGALTGFTLLYSVIITVLYFRRKAPPPPPPPINPYAEVYEEIPAYMAPMTSNGSQKRDLPQIPTANQKKKPPPVPSSKIPQMHYQNQYQSEGSFIRHVNERNQSHWNWTYDEKTEQEIERDRTEYLMAF